MNRTGVLGGPSSASTARHPHALGDHETHATKAPAIDEQPAPGIQHPIHRAGQQWRTAGERGGQGRPWQKQKTIREKKKYTQEAWCWVPSQSVHWLLSQS